MHYYQHHIGDFIRDTSRLTDSQCMAYLRLLWLYYETEEPLQDDTDALAFKIGANALDLQQILRHFFFLHDGHWHQARCDEEILAFRKKSEKAKKSADARWKNANAMRTHSDRIANEPVSDANQEPVTSNQGKEKTKSAARRFDPLSLPLPVGVSAQSWENWIGYRRSRRLPTSEQTARGQIAKLTEWANKGHDTALIIDASITNGWQGLFEPKGNNGPPRANGYHESLTAAGKAIFGDLGNGRTEHNIIDITPASRVLDS